MIEHSRFRLLPMIGLLRAPRPCIQNLLDSSSAKVRQCFNQQSLSIGCERLAQYQGERHSRFTAARQLWLHINQHQCCNRIDPAAQPQFAVLHLVFGERSLLQQKDCFANRQSSPNRIFVCHQTKPGLRIHGFFTHFGREFEHSQGPKELQKLHPKE